MLILTAMILLAVSCLLVLENSIYPVAISLAETEMKNRCMKIINDASDAAVKMLGTEEMITIERDNNGNVVMLTANSEYLNDLNGKMVDISLEMLREDLPKVSIPMGNALGIVVLSDKGPMIDIKTTCSSVAQADFVSEFH